MKKAEKLKQIEEERRLEEIERQKEEQRQKEIEEEIIAEEARMELEQRLAEEERIELEKRIAEEERLLEEERIAEEAKFAEEERLLEEERMAEEKRIAEEERLLEEERIAEEKRLEEERMAEEKRVTKEKRLAEEKRLEEAKKQKFEVSNEDAKQKSKYDNITVRKSSVKNPRQSETLVEIMADSEIEEIVMKEQEKLLEQEIKVLEESNIDNVKDGCSDTDDDDDSYEEKQKREKEEFEKKQFEEKRSLRQSFSIKDYIKQKEKRHVQGSTDINRLYVLRVNVIVLQLEKQMRRPQFQVSFETKPSNKQTMHVSQPGVEIGNSLFFFDINDSSTLQIKVKEETTHTVYQEINSPLNNLELNAVKPINSLLINDVFPGELFYSIQLISQLEGLRQTSLSIQDLRSEAILDGVLNMRINLARNLPPLTGYKEAFCIVKVGEQQPVQTRSVIPAIPNWNHFMSFDCKRDDQVSIELYCRKKGIFKNAVIPCGQVSFSLKGINESIQERWLTILPQESEPVQGQLNISMQYQDNNVEIEGVDSMMVSTLSDRFTKLSRKTQGDIPEDEGEEGETENVKKWDGKAGYLLLRSQKSGKVKRRFFYLLQFKRELVYYKKQQVRYNKQKEIAETPKIIDLAFADLNTINHSNKFVLTLPQRQYVIDATSTSERDDWVRRISEELKSIREFASKDISHSIEKIGRTTYETQKGVVEMLRDKRFRTVSIEIRSGFIFIYEAKSVIRKLIDKLSLYKCFMSEYQPDTISNAICIQDQYKKKSFIFQLDDLEDMHFWLNGMKFQQVFIEEAIDNIVLL